MAPCGKNLFRASGFKRLKASRVLLMIGLGLAGSLFSIGLIVIDDIARQFPSIPALVNDTIRGIRSGMSFWAPV